MSLRDYFKKNKPVSNISQNLSKEEISKEIESPELISAYYELSKKSRSLIDWLNPSEFARYGLAEKYYEDAIKNVYKTYPYDGSYKEKLQWEISSSDLTNYMFENYYPRNNGYINFGQKSTIITGISLGSYAKPDDSEIEYIHFYGTLNTSEKAKNSSGHFEYSNKLDHSQNRAFNLDINGENGNTIEFYLKKDNLNSGSFKQVIVDIWNSSSAASDDYGRYTIEIHPRMTNNDKIFVNLRSGSSGVESVYLGSNLDFTGSWHHYAVTSINSGSDLVLQLFVDGLKVDEVVTGSAIGQIGGAMQGQIGSLITESTAPGATGTKRGWGKLSGSLDEFRFWKKKRTDKEIRRNYFSQIGGGTNTDDANTDLGVYFKFNEGVCTTSASNIKDYDKIVLDYSGRISNGNWVGYTFGSRNTGSALVDSGNTQYEFKDPVVYSEQHQVLEVLNFFKEHGEVYDRSNDSSVYRSFPSWIIDEDSEKGDGLKELMQVVSEFLDDIHLKIKALPSLKNVDYDPEQDLVFTRKLLNNFGFKNLDSLTNSSLLEEFLSKNENENYEEKFYKIKNKIYKNIYNNLLEIYKSKGTTKSLRNILHCFGIDENLVSINLYVNDNEYKFEDRYSNFTLRKKSFNLNNVDRFGSTIYQEQDASNPNSLGYLPGNDLLKYYGNTFETSIIFPKKFEKQSPLYFETNFVSSSLFGIHRSNNGTWITPDSASVQVYAIREERESKDVRFCISSSCFNTVVTSSLIKDVYSDQKWNFSLSLRKNKNLSYYVTDSENDDYTLELYGISSVQDIKKNSFSITASIPQQKAEDFFQSDKMIYLGAHRTNFSGSLLESSDVKIISSRYWNKHLTNNEVDYHAKEENVFGPIDSNNFYRNGVKNHETLALHWNFDIVTGSDNGLYPAGNTTDYDAGFLLNDASSGSLDRLQKNEISPYTNYQFTGKADFLPRNSKVFLNTEYISSILRNNPENLKAEDLTKILTADDEIFTRESTPVNHYLGIEKSMNRVISLEMLNWIGTIKDFNDLIGQPKYRYEQSYKSLDKLRETFFERVEEEPDFEKFIDFYKWIDEAVYVSLLNVIPGSMDMIKNLFNVQESHALERNKYAHKSPIIELKETNIEWPLLDRDLIPWNLSENELPVNAQQNYTANQNSNIVYPTKSGATTGTLPTTIFGSRTGEVRGKAKLKTDSPNIAIRQENNNNPSDTKPKSSSSFVFNLFTLRRRSVKAR